MVINEIRLNPDHHPRCLAHCLGDAGYELGYIGKWHLWANELGNHFDPKNSFVPRGPHRLGFDGYWAAYNFHHEYYGEPAYYHEESADKIHFPEGTYEPDGQTDMAIDYIRQHASGERPFALVLSVGTPHDPWVKENVPSEYYARFEEVPFDVPPNWRQEIDAPYGDSWSDIDKTPQKLDEWMRVYYAMVANLDWNVGRLREAIRHAGIEGDTIFVFTSDHGECFGAHGRMKKNTFYEEAARVPLLMAWPGRLPAGHRSDACLSNVDIMPTLLGLVGGEIPAEAEGMDLSHCARGEAGPEPEFAFMQNTGACAAWEDGHEWRAIRTKQYTYAVYKIDMVGRFAPPYPRDWTGQTASAGQSRKGRELLFDNAADPYQMTNLLEGLTGEPATANGPSDRALRIGRELRAAMEEKMAELNDGFEVSSFYKENWVSEDRLIRRTARCPQLPAGEGRAASSGAP